MSSSKTFNMAGLSTAYLVIPDQIMRRQYEDTRDRIHVDSGNIFGFVAAEAAYSYGDDWLRQLMEYLTGNLKLLQEFMARHIPRVKVIPPQATYLVWLDCKDLGLSSDDLRSFMISKAGLGLNNGIQFGEGGEGFQRINIACPRQTLLNALLKLQKAVDEILYN
jgi:cystathionine beta-lyase